MTPTRKPTESDQAEILTSSSAGSRALPPPAGSAPAAEPVAAATAAETTVPPTPTERDFDITLKNNDNPDKTETVIARGIDGGLAAQAAMRQRPGWTADHSKTQEHGTVPGSTI